jgi:hypothetical protein
MDALQAIASKYNHADALATIAIFALIYLAWRSATVDLAGFGEGIAAIFGGKAAHNWSQGQGQ